jgi:GntR family transcriptional regulator / MocR family aminotransferase
MVFLNRESKEPLYMQIYQQIRNDILNGTIKEGDILAGSRGFARTLNVSRNTVDNAYGQLLAEGYMTPKRGVGYVIAKLPEFKIFTSRQPVALVDEGLCIDAETDNHVLYDLTNSSHTSDLFPRKLWKRYTLECLERLDRETKISSLLDKQGELYLRHSLLLYLERIRGVHCSENQIVITAGVQQSLDYICKLLSTEHPTIFIEEPGYNKAAAVFQNNGMTIQAVSVDEEGIIVSNIPDFQTACAIYSTPSHQFPTGVTMPIGRRYQLLEWAKKNGTYVIEDDFDSELRYYAKPIPSLQSIDKDGRVIYLGTFSKALSPSIRMGYMILPPQLLAVYLDKFQNYNSTAPLLNQYVIARMIESGQYDRHIRRLNNIFRKRLEGFLEEFSGTMGNVKISGNGSGQYFLLEFSKSVNQKQLIQQALEHGVKVYPTMQFWQEKADCPPNTLFLGFSKIDLKNIPDCVTRLKTAWAEWL